MIIYKTINKINGKWYIGKSFYDIPGYLGSGKIIKRAIQKYGVNNFEKVILEQCTTKEELHEREKFWIALTDATNDAMSYNLAKGGEGGDLSKFHNYAAHYGKTDNFAAAAKWFNNLTELQKKEWRDKQAEKRSKGWYVSKVDDPTEIYIQNISKWCEENNVDKSMPTCLNNPAHHMFQKQTKGWRIRRSDMPALMPYEDRRELGHENIACKGKTWRMIDGKRTWFDK